MVERDGPARTSGAYAAAGRRTPAGEAFSQLVVVVARLHGPLTAANDAISKPAALSAARWQVLTAIESAPAPVARIARAIGRSRQSVQRVADLLERDGVAAYEPNPAHRRAKLLRLTQAGRATLHWLRAAQREWANAAGARIGERDLRQACVVLERLLHVVTETPRDR
jgi:DNA-binding MarR family transcriptional regulator